ncbi:MAG: AtpZ/AtpI family protein [Dehalococcoidia bacterium]
MKRNQWSDALRLLGLGWYVVASIIVGLVAGLLLDNWVDTSPLFTLLGLALGLVVALWGLYRLIAPLLKVDQRGKEKN